MMSSSNFATKGSSPHARGAPSFYHVSVLEAVDHPRMRGEHAAMMMAVRVALWIIPACAGSTQSDQCAYHLGWDHPRIRGEHDKGLPAELDEAGSSPHARGAPVVPRSQLADLGIIPECAGSTGWSCPTGQAGRDHPRMRGEHGSAHEGETRGKGSSPHARGARGGRAARARVLGIIPACAGSTVRIPWGRA